MQKIRKIAAVMFVSIAFFSSQSMSAATARNLKCSGCVGSSDIAKNAVTSNRIKNNSVTTSKIRDGAVTREKLGFDVTDELYDLKTGKRLTIRTVIDIDCNTNANTLIEPPYIDNFFPNTTFNITGACNGPLHISSDGVRLVGMEPDRGASIVLPNPTADPSTGTVFVDGASDVRIENLTIDASAWADINAEDTEAAGLYARHAFVRLKDVDVTGGIYGIEAFRNALIRMEGTINITNFVNEGLGAGDQSNIQVRGTSPVLTVSTTNIAAESFSGDDYIIGLSTWRQGIIEVRGVTNISVPTGHEAIANGGQSSVRLRDGGTVVGDISVGTLSSLAVNDATITGELSARDGSILKVSSSTVTGDIDAGNLSGLEFNDVTITGDLVTSEGSNLIVSESEITGDVKVSDNSTGRIYFSSTITGNLQSSEGSKLSVSDSIVTGDLNVGDGSVFSVADSTITGVVQVKDNSAGNIEPNSTINGNTFVGANSSLKVDFSTLIGGLDVSMNSTVNSQDSAHSGGVVLAQEGSGIFFEGSSTVAPVGQFSAMTGSLFGFGGTTTITFSGDLNLSHNSILRARDTANLGSASGTTINCQSQADQVNIWTGGSNNVTGVAYNSCP